MAEGLAQQRQTLGCPRGRPSSAAFTFDDDSAYSCAPLRRSAATKPATDNIGSGHQIAQASSASACPAGHPSTWHSLTFDTTPPPPVSRTTDGRRRATTRARSGDTGIVSAVMHTALMRNSASAETGQFLEKPWKGSLRHSQQSTYLGAATGQVKPIVDSDVNARNRHVPVVGEIEMFPD